MKKFVLIFIIMLFLVVSCRDLSLQAQDEKLLNQCDTLINQWKFDEAETLCKKVIKDNPEDMPAFVKLCAIYTKTGRFEEAFFVIEEMKDLKFDTNLIHLLSGKIYLTQGKFDDVIKEFEAVTDKTSQYYPEALYNLGVTYAKLVDENKSKEYFDAAAKIKPAETEPVGTEQCSVPTLINSAAEDIQNNNYAEAAEKLSKALAAGPYNIDAYYNTAVLNYLEKKYDDSLENLYKITGSKIFYPLAGYLIGKNLAALGRADEAELYLKKTIREYPPLFEAYLALAQINLLAGNYNDAQKYLEAAKALRPGNNNLLTLYGILYFKQGKIKEAIEYFEKARAAYPSTSSGQVMPPLQDNNTINPDIYYNLAACYELTKDNKNAVLYYQKYLQSNPQDMKEIENKIKKLQAGKN